MDSDKTVRPGVLLSVPDGIFLTVGMVIGVGIFKLPSLVEIGRASCRERVCDSV